MTLLDVLTLVPDPRDRRGLRHSWTILLGLAVGVVPCGATSLTGIIRWARGADARLLAALGVPGGRSDALPVAPRPCTAQDGR